ncbi:ankyrin repeat-containing domain protein [Cladorrhinum sp. PSN332]|nr:ankyrin repeat-containing domain protein [Cladorrhinum sp. PSN332]
MLLYANPKTQTSLHSAIDSLISFSPFAPREDPFPPLHKAVISNNLPHLQSLLLHSHDPSQLTSRDSTSWTPLHHAVFQGNAHALHPLLPSCPNPKSIINTPTSTNDTPLHCAVAVRSLPCIELLLLSSNHCDPAIQNSFGNILIQLLITDDITEVFTRLHVEIIRLLLEKSPKTATKRTRQGRAVVHCLVSNPRMEDEVFEELLDVFMGAGAGAQEEIGGLLGYAIARGNAPKRLERLVSKGNARLDFKREGGENILHAAARWADGEVLEYLLRKVGELGIVQVGCDLVADEHLGSPWDTLRYCMTCRDCALLNGRRPSREEAHLFARLFCEVRNWSLRREVGLLRSVLEGKDGGKALEKLAQKDRSETYRVLGIQIREGMWDAAVECVEENIEVCLEEMRASPWGGAGCVGGGSMRGFVNSLSWG